MSAAVLAGALLSLQLGGSLSTYFRAPIKALDKPIQQISTSAAFEASARPTEGTFAKANIRGDLLTPSIAEKVEARFNLREAYAGAHKDGLELRVGQQMINWGNADAVSAIDLLTSRDYTFFSATPDANRLGAPSIMASFAGESTPLRLA